MMPNPDGPIDLATALIIGIGSLAGVVVAVFKLWRAQQVNHEEFVKENAKEKSEIATRLGRLEGEQEGVKMMIAKTLEAVKEGVSERSCPCDGDTPSA